MNINMMMLIGCSIRIARRILLIHVMRRSQEEQDLIHRPAYFNIPLFPVRVGPQVRQQRVENHNGHEADVVVFGRPAALVRVVDEKLLRPRADGLLGRLRHPGLVRVRLVGRHAREQVAVELVPRALHRPAAQPLVEPAGVLEGEMLEDEALALLGKGRLAVAVGLAISRGGGVGGAADTETPIVCGLEAKRACGSLPSRVSSESSCRYLKERLRRKHRHIDLGRRITMQMQGRAV